MSRVAFEPILAVIFCLETSGVPVGVMVVVWELGYNESRFAGDENRFADLSFSLNTLVLP